jgi:ribosomal-protein-alanine N-acetyltransferase
VKLLSARLEIRIPAFGEGAKLADYYRDNQEFLQPFYPRFSNEDFDARAWEASLPHARAEFEARKSMRLCLFEEKRMCGVVNITGVSTAPRFAATLGYSLAADCQGRGLMREALTEIIPFAFARFRLHRIEAGFMPRNERSGRTLAALGFEREGLAKSYLMINGVWEDHVLTAKVNEDWR